jgi:hypothetical protein
MFERSGKMRRRPVLIVAATAVFTLLFAGIAVANNLDRRTAQNAAKFAAKKECQSTSGCTGYGANNVRLLTHHKANGKVFVNSVKNGTQYQCRQQVVITLDHNSGAVRYFLSRRRCVSLGPA